MMRVTEGSASYGTLAGVESAASRLAALQAKLSSGKQITTPSDDPSGTVRALQLRADLSRGTAYDSSSTDALGWMTASDTAYKQIVTLTQSAQTLVVQGLNTGASTGSSAGAIADQIDSIRKSLISVANTTYNGRPVFGGTTAGATAYDASGSYVGDSGAVMRAVGPQSTVQINQTGSQVFGDTTTGSDLFTLLGNISTALRGGDSAALSTDLGSLGSALATVSSAQATEGATYKRVQTTQTAQATTTLSTQSQLSDIQDIDIAQMAVQVTTANTNYQAALQTMASIRQTSLLDFLH